MMNAAIMRLGVKAQRRRKTLVQLPDADLFVFIVHPLRLAIDIDRFFNLMDVSQGNIGVGFQVFCGMQARK